MIIWTSQYSREPQCLFRARDSEWWTAPLQWTTMATSSCSIVVRIWINSSRILALITCLAKCKVASIAKWLRLTPIPISSSKVCLVLLLKDSTDPIPKALVVILIRAWIGGSRTKILGLASSANKLRTTISIVIRKVEEASAKCNTGSKVIPCGVCKLAQILVKSKSRGSCSMRNWEGCSGTHKAHRRKSTYTKEYS